MRNHTRRRHHKADPPTITDGGFTEAEDTAWGASVRPTTMLGNWLPRTLLLLLVYLRCGTTKRLSGLLVVGHSVFGTGPVVPVELKVVTSTVIIVVIISIIVVIVGAFILAGVKLEVLALLNVGLIIGRRDAVGHAVVRRHDGFAVVQAKGDGSPQMALWRRHGKGRWRATHQEQVHLCRHSYLRACLVSQSKSQLYNPCSSKLTLWS
jgi:hypothetical protein